MTTYWCSTPLPPLYSRQKVRGFSPKGEEVWIKRFRIFNINRKLTILEYTGEFRKDVACKMEERVHQERDGLIRSLPLNRTYGLECLLGEWLRVYVDPFTRHKLAYPIVKDRGFAWLRNEQIKLDRRLDHE